MDDHSPEFAVRIDATSTDDGIREEYEYIVRSCGREGLDWFYQSQKTESLNDRQFDVVTVRLSNGSRRSFRFDITAFFGRNIEAIAPTGPENDCFGAHAKFSGEDGASHLARFRDGELDFVDIGITSRHPAELLNPWSLELNSGRLIHLESMRQGRTYAGLLEGLKADINLRIGCAMETAAKEFASVNAAPVLIRPVLLRGWMRTGSPGPDERLLRWCALPEIVTIALFNSHAPARNPDDVFSSLVLVWFQTHWGIPADPLLIAGLKQVDWDGLAVDGSP